MDPFAQAFGPDFDSRRALIGAALVATRLLPLTLLAPWLAMRAAPNAVRMAVTLAFTVALTPFALARAPGPLATGVLPLTSALIVQAFVGAVFALAAALPFYAFDWAGRLVDSWRGASSSEVAAALGGEPTSPLGQLHQLLAVVLFVTLGGYRVAFRAFVDSFEVLPLGGSLSHDWSGVAYGAARLSADALALAVVVAAPAAAALVLLEVALGLLARAAPTVPVFFAGMPLRAALGVAAVLLALTVWTAQVGPVAVRALNQAGQLLRLLVAVP